MTGAGPRDDGGTTAGKGEDEVYLVDGSGLAYRSFFAFQRRPLRTSTGIETSAVFGFVQTLIKILERKPAYIAVVFDRPGPTFRHERFSQYKANRPPTPESLIRQMGKIREIVKALGIRVLEEEGVEADDVVATLAREGNARGLATVMVSGDKDLLQLVGPRVRVLVPGSGPKGPAELDAEGVERKLGVRPERVVDLLGLMGDATDNVPGVPGVGAKTAASLIAQFGSIDGVYARLDQVEPERVRRALEAHRTQAYLSRELVELKDDVPLAVDVDALRPGSPDRSRLRILFAELEFTRLLAEIVPREAGEPAGDSSLEEVTDLGALVRVLREGEALTVELTSDPGRDHGPQTLLFRPGNGRVYTVDVRRAGRRGLDQLRPVLESDRPPKWVLGGKRLAKALAVEGLELGGVEFDVELAAYLLDPGREHDLAVLCAQYLGRCPEGIAPGRGRASLEIPFADGDEQGPTRVRLIPDLVSAMAPLLEDRGLVPLFREIEIPLAPVLGEMERAGVKVDVTLLRSMGEQLAERIRELEQDVYDRVGETFNLASPQQLKRILFDVLGLKPGRRTKTGFSTDQGVLEALGREHEVPRLVLEHRHLTKIKSTYIDPLPGMVDPSTGRIHTTFHQTVTATGRLSSSDPNLQNIPMRSEIGRTLRKAFVASGPDWRIHSADYSQIELRIVAHLAGDRGLAGAFRRGEDIHRATAAAVSGVRPEDISPADRDRAKAVNFGIIYGMGPRALAASVGIEVSEAKAFIEKYFESYPGVRSFIDETVADARRTGYVTTLFGRRRYLPGIDSENPRERAFAERTAVNTRVQGTAADIIKRAMVEIARRLRAERLAARMILQVHDELVFDAPSGEVDGLARIVAEAMVGASALDVPVEVTGGTGRNWFEAH